MRCGRPDVFMHWLRLLHIRFLLTLVQAEMAFSLKTLSPSFVQSVLSFLSDSSHGSASSRGLILELKEASQCPFLRCSPVFLCPQAVEIEDRRILSCVHFMTLKKLNRLAHIRLKKGRDQTHEVGVEKLNPPFPPSFPPPSQCPAPLFLSLLPLCSAPSHPDLPPHLPLTLTSFQAKQKVDAYHLQLQNLLYEVMHLQKEITKCLEFK